ncbi:MAG: O-antigen ligase family protein [Bacteroidales bacterium]|nr:O-antigen ligase family protein [Bacteroidales bacterium]
MAKRKYSKKVRRNNTIIWYVLGCMILLVTLSYSMRLVDASNIVRYTLMSAFLSLICIGMALNKRRPNIPITFGLVSFGIFVVMQGVSMIWAPNFAEALFDVSKWIMILLTIIISCIVFKRKPVHAICMLSAVSAIVFLVSTLVAFKQMVDINSLSWSDRYGIVSLFTHKGTYSMMLLFMAAFPIMRLRLKIKRGKNLYRILLVGILLMLLLLQSRAILVAIVAILIVGVVLRILKLKTMNWKVVLPAKILLTVVVCGALVLGCRWFSTRTSIAPNNLPDIRSNTTIVERQMLWSNTFKLVDKSPFLGCGAGNWKICYPETSVGNIFSVDILDRVFIRPHNEYLRVLSETGYVALFLLILSISSLFVESAKKNIGRCGIVKRVGMSFVAGVLAFSLFDFPFDRIELILWTSMLVGCVMAMCNSCRKSYSNRFFWYVAALLMLFTCIVGISRWHSESLYVDMSNDIHNSKWSKVEVESRDAHTIFCNISPIGLPYKYYEGMACEYQKKQSIDCFRTAVHDCPNCKQALCDLGRLEYVVDHNFTEAEKNLRKAIGISPSYAYPYFNLAEILIKEHRYDEAIATLESLDLKQKQQKIDEMIWLYVKENDTKYYRKELVPAEAAVIQQMLSRIYTIKEQQNIE